MDGTPGYTREEIRDIVHHYYRLPHGSRLKWLEDQPFSHATFRRWRKLVYGGDLHRNLAPRKEGDMFRTPQERDAYEEGRAKELATRATEREQYEARIRELEGMNDALGKAIGLLHSRNAQEPDATPPTNTPSSS